MKQIDLENYIGVLLANPNVYKKILDEIQNIELLLSVYKAGLKKEDFPIDYLFKEFALEEDIPTQFHILVGQMAILKAKINEAPKNYLKLTVVNLLEEYKNYFLPR